MTIDKDKNMVIIKDIEKEVTIEKLENDVMVFSFYNSNIENNNDKALEISKENIIVYESIKTLFMKMKKEYCNYKDYFDKIYSSFIDEKGNVKNIVIYNKEYDSFIFYSDNGNFNNNSYIRIFKNKEKYYIYFNRPSLDFIINEENSKFKYNSFHQYFVEFYNNVREEKRNKIYGKFKNFNNSI